MSEKKILEVSQNKKAYHDFEILDTIEAGIELKGTEIKSIRDHSINLKDSFVMIRNGEARVHNLHISPYGFGNIFNHEPLRIRRLLLHKKEILKLAHLLDQKGGALVPLKVYIKGRYAKLLLGLAKGKKMYDKRQSLREKDIRREMDRELKDLR
jgi:SsrA-binding protein